MRNKAAIILSATVIFLALILPYPSAAETLLAPRTTTTPQTTTPTNPALMQQPVTTIHPQVGNALISVGDIYGTPVTAAAVDITSNLQHVTRLTNIMGEASFSNLGVGLYSYSVSKAGYYPQIINKPLSISSATTTASQYVLIQYGRARVNVVDNGVAVEGANVSVAVNRQYQDAKTDAGGMAFFVNLPPGSYSFTVSRMGYSTNHATANVVSGKQVGVTIAISHESYLLPPPIFTPPTGILR